MPTICCQHQQIAGAAAVEHNAEDADSSASSRIHIIMGILWSEADSLWNSNCGRGFDAHSLRVLGEMAEATKTVAVLPFFKGFEGV
jgi:hypothetical protein